MGMARQGGRGTEELSNVGASEPISRRRFLWAMVGTAGLGAASKAPAAVAEADPHANHRVAATSSKRTVADYAVPNVQLVRQDGRLVTLADEVGDDRPVVMAFIYTSCKTVCPVVSQVLSNLQSKLGLARDKVHLMSISIDPEFDTPARLRDYAQQFGAGPEWNHYTGTVSASRLAQRAFNVYRGDKMSHQPAVLVRPMPGARWVRIDGFASADELLAELPDYCLSR